MSNDLIPVNIKGKPTDLEFSVACATKDQARHCYMRAVKRMQNPQVWHELAGWASASFKLVDMEGLEVNRLAAQGDYLRIDIPGPGPTEGGGYDWVKVEKMEEYIDSSEQREWTGMKVRPCGNPSSPGSGTAHFFMSDASSIFIIERNGDKVTAFYHGRNEVPNTSTGKWTDNIRNTLVAAGAVVGLSEAQWSALCKGFLAEEIGGNPPHLTKNMSIEFPTTLLKRVSFSLSVCTPTIDLFNANVGQHQTVVLWAGPKILHNRVGH